MEVDKIKLYSRFLEKHKAYDRLHETHHRHLHDYCKSAKQKKIFFARNRNRVLFKMLHLRHRLQWQDSLSAKFKNER